MVLLVKKKKKNFIKPQYSNSINTQHCGRLPEKTNVHYAGHLGDLAAHEAGAAAELTASRKKEKYARLVDRFLCGPPP